jgi:hypothetical protein
MVTAGKACEHVPWHGGVTCGIDRTGAHGTSSDSADRPQPTPDRAAAA